MRMTDASTDAPPAQTSAEVAMMASQEPKGIEQKRAIQQHPSAGPPTALASPKIQTMQKQVPEKILASHPAPPETPNTLDTEKRHSQHKHKS